MKEARETVGIIETLDFRLVEDGPLKKIFLAIRGAQLLFLGFFKKKRTWALAYPSADSWPAAHP